MKIQFDDGGSKIQIDGVVSGIAPATGSVGSCGGGLAIAGVSSILAGGESFTGDVQLVAGSGTEFATSGGQLTISASGVARLRDLLDVAITTDGNGEPIVSAGSVLRFQDYETGGVWIADDTLDGGGY